ncbi:hypothetical protein PIIN_10769 [Serendipita indica DSM 11827]|uniref:Uncharacterized protein n=1 Tax=Serendipita indica (strain DSM 11827) TaxID=1109443 RepID=G4TZP0_SERID|nr:hypothetical protein PIIN_10769 [Serendipita indica DSM 11827]
MIRTRQSFNQVYLTTKSNKNNKAPGLDTTYLRRQFWSKVGKS